MDLICFLINICFAAYYLLIVLRALLPFIPHNRQAIFIKQVYDLTEPVLLPVRQGLPPSVFGYDVSPFLIILFLAIVQRLILYILGGL
ncbi:MAG TPA: YggT family protein [Candidatus Omnitrophota bacterium]|nr:YggT family protein [Candidatus Omnitrophota bacterium]